ncbi:transglycosylase SLT domain-containing protein [Actinospica durhamensis]|uniref:Transglycosylase SLT domain-containing protein n=1 Tax=Actinospica durhamensis TaxID=1508375 RepID=A0A941ES42_9ACTN|nr:transglycosylase SLT domain-containing protein [Actinospica durhamensis]MBR7832819.1 transglycosylase SLT domain-containing protein [Actinospica durhamensis]
MPSDQYRVDLDSVSALTKTWESAAQSVTAISRQLATVHERLEQAIPGSLIDGLLGEVPLLAAFAALAAATKDASALAQGLAQDVASLAQNRANYEKAEAEVTARLKAEQEQQAKAKKAHSPHGGSTATSGGRGRHAGSGGGSGSSGSSGSSGGGHSGSGGSGGSGGGSVQPPGPAHYANQEQVGQWIDQAFALLEANGVPASELDKAGVLLIIEHESSGNPNAVNNWDSNAQAGDPSRGLMQTIGTTFDAYKLPGHDDIYNPVDNIIAGVRYALSRYGSIQNVPGVKSVDHGGSYIGY